MNIRFIALVLIGTGVLCVIAGAYLLNSKEKNSITYSQTPNFQTPNSQMNVSETKTSTPNCVVLYQSGSCWTIPNPPQRKSNREPSDANFSSPKVQISGNTCTVIVPASARNGVKANGCEVRAGEAFEITATGTVLFSTDHPRSDANGLNGWYDPKVDSPFNQNVGGLEFSIGSLPANRYFAGTFYRGTASESGELIFRVIDQKEGEGKSGGFTVTVKKLK